MTTTYTVLIIEDEKTLREGIAEALRKEHVRVLEADDGAVGWSMAQKESPDAVVLDVLLPTMNGKDVLEKLRAGGKHIPVLLLSNVEDPSLTPAPDRDIITSMLKGDWKPEDIVARLMNHLTGADHGKTHTHHR